MKRLIMGVLLVSSLNTWGAFSAIGDEQIEKKNVPSLLNLCIQRIVRQFNDDFQQQNAEKLQEHLQQINQDVAPMLIKAIGQSLLQENKIWGGFFNCNASTDLVMHNALGKYAVIHGEVEFIVDQSSESFAISCLRFFSNSLQRVDLSYNFLCSKGAENFAEALSKCAQLKRLNFSGNYIGSKGMECLLQSLHSPCLEMLNLSSNDIRFEGMWMLAGVLGNFMQLKNLYLYGNHIGPEGMKDLADALVTVTELEVLDLGGNKIGCVGLKALKPAFSKLRKLKELNFSSNEIGDEGMGVLASVLGNFTQLKKMYLGDNNISLEGMKDLAGALRASPSELKVLYLRMNKIDDEGVKVLESAFYNLHKLTNLDFSYNAITDEGVKVLVRGLGSQLKVLNLKGNAISAEGRKILEEVSEQTS